MPPYPDHQAIRPFWPSESDPGAVGAGIVWVKLSTGEKWIRNDDNDDWISLDISNGGAPADAKYVVSAADATLSNEIVIPGQAGSADIAGVGGAGTSEEWDTGTTGLTWGTALAAEDSNTTRKSHLYMNYTGTGENIGTKSWAPGSGAFDARAKVSIGSESTSIGMAIGLHIGDSGNNNRLLAHFLLQPGSSNIVIQAYTYASATFTQRGINWTVGSNEYYLRITRDGSNNCSFYWSADGYAWQLIATQSFTLTIANIGFRLGANSGAASITAFADWLRTSV